MGRQRNRVVGDKKWLVLRYSEPQGTLLKLGSILTEPYDPEKTLTEHTPVVPITSENEVRIRNHSKALSNFVRADTSQQLNISSKANITAPSVAKAGASIEAHKSATSNVTLSAEKIQAFVFNPSDVYMNKVLELPKVIENIRGWGFQISLYVIVGVATAKGLHIEETTYDSRQAKLAGCISVPDTGIEGDVEAGYTTDTGTSSAVSASEWRDFAYRVREFKYRRWFKKKLGKGRDVTDAALMGKNDEPDIVDYDSCENDSAEYMGLEEYDVDPNDEEDDEWSDEWEDE